MNRSHPVRQDLHDTIRETLALLQTRPAPGPQTANLPAAALPSLLERCRQMTEATAQRGPAPVATVHHLACTGGTLISRCLASLPNVRLLSEVDPLSRINEHINFVPSDMVRLARKASRPVAEATTVEIFMAGLEVVRRDCREKGYDLVLRDHSHSAFHHGAYHPERPILRDLLRARMPLRSLVTVRHPLDSYLSMLQKGWEKHFSPSSLEEYARRYQMFLDRHADLDIMRYEDFLSDPQEQFRRASKVLDLTWSDMFPLLFQSVQLSGNSGRGGESLAPHPRRKISEQLEAQRRQSRSYAELCARLGYEV